jgi:hypothetical protein
MGSATRLERLAEEPDPFSVLSQLDTGSGSGVDVDDPVLEL